MKKQDKIYWILIIGTVLAFSLAIKTPDCYFPEEKIETQEPTQSSIKDVNNMLVQGPVAMPVVGLSMYPVVKPGSICICEKEDDYFYDDIISFNIVYEGQLYFVMHKIVDTIPNEGFITKGTNNNRVDPWIINESQIFCSVKKISLLEKIFRGEPN